MHSEGSAVRPVDMNFAQGSRVVPAAWSGLAGGGAPRWQWGYACFANFCRATPIEGSQWRFTA